MNRVGIGVLVAACVLGCAACGSTRQEAAAQVVKRDPGTFDTPVPSRDGKRIAVVRHYRHRDYLEVGPAGGGPRRTVYSASDFVDNVVWASRYVIAFDNDFSVDAVDIRTRNVRTLATAEAFNISGDGRWIAWWMTGHDESIPSSAGVVSVAGHEYLVVPTPRHSSDIQLFFHPDSDRRIYFMRLFPDRPSRMMSLPLSSLKRPAS
jgi:hypothetical protein